MAIGADDGPNPDTWGSWFAASLGTSLSGRYLGTLACTQTECCHTTGPTCKPVSHIILSTASSWLVFTMQTTTVDLSKGVSLLLAALCTVTLKIAYINCRSIVRLEQRTPFVFIEGRWQFVSPSFVRCPLRGHTICIVNHLGRTCCVTSYRIICYRLTVSRITSYGMIHYKIRRTFCGLTHQKASKPQRLHIDVCKEILSLWPCTATMDATALGNQV